MLPLLTHRVVLVVLEGAAPVLLLLARAELLIGLVGLLAR